MALWKNLHRTSIMRTLAKDSSQVRESYPRRLLARMRWVAVAGVVVVGCGDSNPSAPTGGQGPAARGGTGNTVRPGGGSDSTVYVTSQDTTGTTLVGGTVEGETVVKDGEIVGEVVDEGDLPTPESVGAASDTVICVFIATLVLDHETGTVTVESIELLYCTWRGGKSPSEPTVELKCSKEVPRGSTGGCEVKIEDSNVSGWSVTYSWKAGTVTREGTGDGFASWKGQAVDNLSFQVTLTGEGLDGVDLLEGEVTVEPRKWGVSSAPASVSYVKSFSQLPDGATDNGNNVWGTYAVGPLFPEPRKAFAGPWEDLYWVAEQPVFRGQIEIHADLSPDGSGPKYPSSSMCSPDSDSLADSASIYSVNTVCKLGGNLTTFREEVLTHEKSHESSLNNCELSLAKLERAIGSKDDVQAAITEAEDKLEGGVLRSAMDNDAPLPTSPTIWHYRALGAWHLGGITFTPHKGGCSTTEYSASGWGN